MRNILSAILLSAALQPLATLPCHSAGKSPQFVPVFTPANTAGRDSTDKAGVFVTYRRPVGYPYIEKGGPSFAVAVDGTYTALYNDTNYWGGNVAFGSFGMADGREVEVSIASKRKIESFELLPAVASLTMRPVLEGNTVRFRTRLAGQKFTLVINGDYRGDVLHLFADAIDRDVPPTAVRARAAAPQAGAPVYVCDSTEHTVYFGPGFHRLKDKPGIGSTTLDIGGDWTVYIDGGAVVEGQMNIRRGKGARIRGRGMLVNAERKVTASIDWSADSRIEGIIIHGHRSQCWNTVVGSSQRSGYSDTKLITTHYASTDGLDVNHSQDCTFDNVFIRSADDAVAIKGLAPEDKRPADCPPNRNLVFTRMQLWNDCNNAFGMGAETRASAYENIRLENSDILFSYDDPNFHEKLSERSAMNICALQGTWFRNIVFDGVRVGHCERLIGMGFKGDFWFGAIQGDQTTEGGIDGVVFRNITSPNTSGSSIANDILLYGWHKEGTPDKLVENITFDNVSIMGRKLSSADSPYIKTGSNGDGSLVRNLRFE